MSFAQVPEDVFNHVSSFLPPPRPRDRERGDKLGGRVSLVCRGWLDFGRARGWKVLEIRGHELEDWMNFFGANPQLSPFVREVFFSVDDFRQEDSRSGGPSSTALLDLLNLFDNLRKFDSLDHSCHCDSRIFPLFALKSNLLSLTLDLARLDVPLFVPSLSQGFATLNYLYLHFDDVSPSDPLTPPSETCLPHLRSLRLSSNSSGRFLSILPDLFDFEKLSTVSLEGGGLTLSSTAQLESLNLGYGLRSLKLSFAPDALESLLENLTKMLSKLQSLENLDIDTGHGLTCIKSKEACRNFLEATGPEIRKIEIGGVVFESIGSFASVEWKDISMSQVEVQVRLAEGREYRKLVRIVDGNGERKWVFLVPSLSSRSAVCVMMDVPSSSSCRMFVPNRIDHLRAHFADHRIGHFRSFV